MYIIKRNQNQLIVKQSFHLNQYQRRYHEYWALTKGQLIWMSSFYEFHYLEPWNLFMLIKKSRKPRKLVGNKENSENAYLK